MIRWISGLAIAAALVVPALAADDNMEILRQKVKADKKLVVAAYLELTDAEGKAFWPVYDAYQKELKPINERMAALILAYADAYNKGAVSNEEAKKLIEEAVAIDTAGAKLKASSAPKIMAVLPGMKAARYIQIENKIRAAINYEMAAGIPLVQ
jgi:hypothetical protein